MNRLFFRSVGLATASGCLAFGCSTEEIKNPVRHKQQEISVSRFITVPVRWCSVAGAPTAADPDRAVGEPSLNAALKRRMDRANDGILLPEVNIALRSAIVSDPAAGKSFPILPDLDPVGQPGDVIDPQEDDGADLEAHLNACTAAWEALLPGVASDVGILALNVRRFVTQSGSPVSLLGIARSGGYNDLGGRKIAMIDPAFTQWNGSEGREFAWGDEVESIFAHEAAHSWPIAVESMNSSGTFVQGLHHTHACAVVPGNLMNGFVNGGDRNEDTFFDRLDHIGFSSAIQQDFHDPFGFAPNSCETVNQFEMMRLGSPNVPGCKIDGGNADCALLADVAVDARSDVTGLALAEVDINTMDISEPEEGTVMSIAHELFGFLDTSAADELSYFAAFDLDDNNTTGGNPSAVGMNTAFAGAELVTRVTVVPGNAPTHNVWKHNGSSFVASTDPGIVSGIRQIVYDSDDTSVFGPNVVEISIPTSVRGPRSAPMRMHANAVATQGGSTAIDHIINDPAGVLVGMPAPTWPSCTVDVETAQNGDTVTVDASGLLPNQAVHVVFGDEVLEFGSTDGSGSASLSITVPEVTTRGRHSVTVGNDGTALHAVCVLDVELATGCQPGVDVGAPTLTVPPDITVKTCERPNLGTASATDPEGCPVEIVNDAPGVFKPGETFIHWRAADLAGNRVVGSQRVWVDFEDESCCPPGTNIIHGDGTSETLYGTEEDDCFIGWENNDWFYGLGGNDHISGGLGDDVLLGDSGLDTIFGNDGEDYIEGGDDHDFISGGEDNDILAGQVGHDTMYGDGGEDLLDGGAWDDILYGGDQDDLLEGGAGNNTLVAGSGVDECSDVEGNLVNYYYSCENRPATEDDGCEDGSDGRGIESDNDCGGPCAPCTAGQECEDIGDCEQGNVCPSYTFVDGNQYLCTPVNDEPFLCTDTFLNGTETDEDCGGDCNPCDDGLACEVDDDCQSLVCDGAVCTVPSCSDEVENGDEEGVDCGGACTEECCIDVAINAEDMNKTAGGTHTNGWNLHSNGYVSFTRNFNAGPQPMIIRAFGQNGNGWPHMRVRFNGAIVYETDVVVTSYTDYPVTINASGGNAEVRVEFTNDFYQSVPGSTPIDRNLFIDTVTVQSGSCDDGGFECTGACLSATPLVQYQNSGNFGTTGERWFVVSGTINGWQASQIQGRSITVNGVPVSPGQMPLPPPVGGLYYFHFSAGANNWSSWSFW